MTTIEETIEKEISKLKLPEGYHLAHLRLYNRFQSQELVNDYCSSCSNLKDCETNKQLTKAIKENRSYLDNHLWRAIKETKEGKDIKTFCSRYEEK